MLKKIIAVIIKKLIIRRESFIHFYFCFFGFIFFKFIIFYGGDQKQKVSDISNLDMA